jgi:two-component sensor histidine kinase
MMPSTVQHRSSGHTMILLQEIHHRVANELQGLVGALSPPRAKQMLDGSGAVARAVERIGHIARLNRQIYEAPTSLVFSQHCRELCAGVLSAFGRSDIVLLIDFTAEPASREQRLTVALIVVELLTNAVKHSLADERDACIRLELTTTPCGSLRLTASDSATIQEPRSLTSSSIVRLLAEDAGGSVTITADPGYIATVVLPKY